MDFFLTKAKSWNFSAQIFPMAPHLTLVKAQVVTIILNALSDLTAAPLNYSNFMYFPLQSHESPGSSLKRTKLVLPSLPLRSLLKLHLTEDFPDHLI